MNNGKSKYISSAFVLIVASLIVKLISAIYKIPLTSYIGTLGRGYFSAAYTLCMPVHALTMGCFPIALSRLVSKYNACGNKTFVAALKHSSHKIFFAVGFCGMVIIMLCAYPYSAFIAHSPKCIYTIFALAPSVLFSCICASYRSYYEGFQNMTVTAVSQLIEAAAKSVLGIVFAKISLIYMFSQYMQDGAIFSCSIAGEKEAVAFMYPFTACAAMFGVTVGGIVSLCYAAVYDSFASKRNVKINNSSACYASKELVSFAMPIMASCAVQSVFSFLDTATVQKSLALSDETVLRQVYSGAFAIASVSSEDIATYLYGVYSAALDFKNLVPGITMSLGIAAVPAVSSACESKDKQREKLLVNAVFKYSSLISVFCGVCLYIYCDDILDLFYSSSSPDLVVACAPLLKTISVCILPFSLAGTAVFTVQAIGCPEKSIFPYAASGVIRVVLNVVLILNKNLILHGAVIAGAVGYLVMFILNLAVIVRVRKFRINFYANIFKPIAVGIASFYISRYINSYIDIPKNESAELFCKVLLTVIIFCILCFWLNLLNLNTIFLNKKCKKTA